MMNRKNLYESEREALRELAKLVEARVEAEKACGVKYEAAKLTANREVARSRKSIAAEREREQQGITVAWEEKRKAVQERFATEQAAADRLCTFTAREARERAKTEEDKTQTAYSDALWTAESLHEAAEKEAADQLDLMKRKAVAAGEAIESIWKKSAPFLERGKLSRADFPEDAISSLVEVDDPGERMDAALARADEELVRLQGLRSLRRVGLGGFLRWFVLFAALAAIPPLTIHEDRLWLALGGAALAISASAIAHLIARSKARRRCQAIGADMATALFEAEQSRNGFLRKAVADHDNRFREAARLRDGSKTKAKEKYPPILAKNADRCRAEISAADDKHERDAERLRNWQYEALKKTEGHYAPALQQCHARFDGSLADAEALFERRKEESRTGRERDWNAFAWHWSEGQDRLIDVFNHLKATEAEHFLPWYAPFWQNFSAPNRVPAGIRFGSICIDLEAIPGGIPEDEDLAPTLPRKMELPAFLPFPEKCALILKASDEGRTKAVQELQTIMLRFLTAIPAGKVRFTIVDPVGLGDNFGAFMHLGDYDENLIGSRIWTETAQIEKKLADITTHMENVIQKYLRNQYKSIEEYNAQAGEVAEPFRVLVVANFPANFNLESARRLVSIVQSGSTCGVYTLISVDTKQPLPQGFNIADLEQGSTNLIWKDQDFQWKDPDLAKFHLSLEVPPPPDDVVRLVRIVGERGKNANRVEVPFDYVAPPNEAVWKGDARKSIAVPIGRSGATKQQLFVLGVGTAQHALIAGKTGSGKSTLLHALITNIGLHYSPDEVELYLIDFKKGVEFKAYAESKMPHARVVAIESEREFGLSVLQRLDGILRERGDRFRDASVTIWRAIEPIWKRRKRSPRRRKPTATRPAPLAAREFCWWWTNSKNSSWKTTGSRKIRPCCSTAWCVKAGRSASMWYSVRKPSAVPSRSPAVPSTRWPCASPCSAARPMPN